MTRLAICHPETLLGKELRDTLGRRAAGPDWEEIRLVTSDSEQVGALTEIGGAAAIVQAYDGTELAEFDIVFFCGKIAVNRPLLAALPSGVRAVVLSTDAELGDGEPVVSGVNAPTGASVILSPHPAVVLLAHLLRPLASLEPVEAVATVVLPASLHEEAGIDELFAQARTIVTMTARKPSRLFGAQLAFNLLPAAADQVRPLPGLLTQVLGTAPTLRLDLLQAGVFHCLSVSLFVRCREELTPAATRRLFRNAPLVRFATVATRLGPVQAAASEHVLVGQLRRSADGLWLWAAMDNLTRGGALNALDIATAVLAAGS